LRIQPLCPFPPRQAGEGKGGVEGSRSSSLRSINCAGATWQKKKGSIRCTIRPLTPDLWPALEDLFGKSGASNGCWCMYWRLGGAYRDAPRGANREALRQIVERGSPPGLLAFDGDLPVGWCQLTPRDALPWLDHMWWFARVDAEPVWSISCFFVRRGYRRQRVMTQLILGFEDRKACEGAGARRLSYRHERTEKHIEYLYRYRRCVRTRGVQGGRSPCIGSTHRAP
jgi:Acetyltransferase (GNAT) family